MRALMRVALVALVAGVAGLVTLPSAAATSVEWCYDDPVVDIGGQRVSITAGVRGEPDLIRRQVEKARFVIYAPEGVRMQLISQTNTYFEEEVEFRALEDAGWQQGDPIPVVVRLTFDTRARFDARVDVVYRDGTEQEFGTTARPLWSTFVLY